MYYTTLVTFWIGQIFNYIENSKTQCVKRKHNDIIQTAALHFCIRYCTICT